MKRNCKQVFGMEITELISQYTEEGIREYRRLEGGHINVSFYVKGEKGEYLLQRLNGSLFGERTELLGRNYLAYVRACEMKKDTIRGWELPHWLRCRKGGFFVNDGTGVWRMYEYIKGDTPKVPLSREQIRACGRGLAELHTILSGMEAAEGVLPGFHDLRAYHEEYLAAEKTADKALRDPELEEFIARGAEAVLNIELPGDSMIHGDARIGNMIFRKGRMVAMIDLDTIMRGARILDLADCIRSMGPRGALPDAEMQRDLLDVYENSVSPSLSPEERDSLPLAYRRICFELGLRYYTDHLKGNVYFAQDRPGQNLEKAGKILRGCCAFL